MIWRLLRAGAVTKVPDMPYRDTPTTMSSVPEAIYKSAHGHNGRPFGGRLPRRSTVTASHTRSSDRRRGEINLC